MYNANKALDILEFPKLLECLSSYATSTAGRKACLSISPFANLQDLYDAESLLSDISVWINSLSNGKGDRVSTPAMDEISSIINFPDCSFIIDALDNQSIELDADALFILHSMLKSSIRLVKTVLKDSNHWSIFAHKCSFDLPENLADALSRCFDDDATIKDTATPRLLEIRSEMRSIHRNCLKRVREFAIEHSIAQYMQDDFITLLNDRYVLPIKTNFKGRVNGIVHSYSNTGETCYFEPIFLLELNNRLQELKHNEHIEEHSIIASITSMVKENSKQIHDLWNFMIDTDIALAKLRFADATSSIMLHVAEDSKINIESARHPLLIFDQVLKKNGGPHPVTISFRSNDLALVITGGNAGGKTVCLKTLGLICIMAYSAIPVPVNKCSTLPWLPNIHAFIGDEQSIDNHLSTFTAQIKSLADIWQNISSNTLILLDEFGSGTDPAHGSALAQAVIEGIIQRGAIVVAATHFPALKNYALTHEGTRVASMLFDSDTKKPLYTIAYDQIGASLALDVARKFGLDESVIAKAEHYLLSDGNDTTELTNRLNQLAIEREFEIDKLKQEREKNKEITEKVKLKLKEERDKLEFEIKQVALDIARALREEKITAKQALRELNTVKARLEDIKKADEDTQTPEYVNIDNLKIGDIVFHTGLQKEGTVVEIDPRNARVKMNMRGISVWAKSEILTFNGAVAETLKKTSTTVNLSNDSTPYSSIDLRGKRVDEAMSSLQHFLDHAILSGVQCAEIIHGRGTGVLRREIHSFLRTYPAIASYSIANEDHGGDGVTLINFE